MATDPKLFKIADTLSKLTVLEAKELVRILEEDYDIKAPKIAPTFIPTMEPVVEVEQTEFDVYLKEAGGQKLQIVKKVKEIMGLGLRDAKDLIYSALCLLRKSALKVEADLLKIELENLGAIVEIR